MKLYIKLQNGQPIDHPMIEENLLQVVPNINLEMLPSDYMEFLRIAKPVIGAYQVYEGTTYEISDGVCKDVHQVRDMTVEEKNQKQTEVQSQWNSAPHSPKSWVFNEELCFFESPLPYPDDGKQYEWNEESVSWSEIAT